LALTEVDECKSDLSAGFWKCRIEVYTKYGMADELAEAKEKLAKVEVDKSKSDAAAEASRRSKEAHEKRCSLAPRLSIGMTADQVIGSQWGSPSDRHTTTARHQREQWVYEYGPNCRPTLRQSYLYFDDGILTAIQD